MSKIIMIKQITESAATVISYINLNVKKKMQVMDPISTIIKLGILSYKPNYTKIGIHNNRMYFYDPKLMQGIQRWLYGDCRYDLSCIYHPILFYAFIRRKYIESDKDVLIIINKMGENAALGLKKLKETYQDNKNYETIVSCIDFYMDILTKHDEAQITSLFENLNDTLKAIYSALIEKWDVKYLFIIDTLFEDLKNNKNNELIATHIIASLENIIEIKEVQADENRNLFI